MLRTVLLLILASSTAFAAPEFDLAPLKKWFGRQNEIRSVTADFTQTRSLRALRDPVATPGRLWFSVPGSVRWELGSPPKTIALRKGANALIITPGKKRAERHNASAASPSAGGGALAMLRFPLAKDFADFQRQFEVLAITPSGERCRVEVAPRDPQARKFLSRIVIEFNQVNGHLLSFEMVTRDGSKMRQEFSNVRTNVKIPATTFDYDLSGYDVKDAKE